MTIATQSLIESVSGAGDSTIAFYTLGCRLNTADTQRLEKEALSRGYRVVPFQQQAAVYVVNTCTVTGQSDLACQKVARQARRRNPYATVVAVGCYVQAHANASASLPEVDLLLRNADKDDLFDKLATACPSAAPRSKPKTRLDVLDESTAPPVAAANRHRAFLKVQEGCDERCAYCIVPRARGASRSLPLDELKKEVLRLAESGYREVVIVGVHLGDYGAQLNPRQSLATLLQELAAVAAPMRVRLSSVEPDAVTTELADAMQHPSVCQHVHLPIQSGSDRVLALMRRPYRKLHVDTAVQRLTQASPDIGLGADFIVGFPGESESEFQETCALVERLPLAYLHVFPYSPRPDTEASTMPDQVPEPERDRRVKVLSEIGKRKQHQLMQAQLGRCYSAWLYPGNERTPELLRGLTSNYLRVTVPAPREWINEIANVRIQRYEGGRLFGELAP